MNHPLPEITEPQTTAELGYYIKRSARWVAEKCSSGEFETLPIGKPYMIPAHECNRILRNERNTANYSGNRT